MRNEYFPGMDKFEIYRTLREIHCSASARNIARVNNLDVSSELLMHIVEECYELVNVGYVGVEDLRDDGGPLLFFAIK